MFAYRFFGFLLILSFTISVLTAQSSRDEPGVVYLTNPSFEDLPRIGKPPSGWQDCGFPNESAPDVQPDPLNNFRVSKAAHDGNTYLGMVVRDNDTWESVGQPLSQAVVPGTCYDFRLYLARSEIYMSLSQKTGQPANYVTPAKLRIWLGNGPCDKAVMVAESRVITEYRWIEYRFKLKADKAYTHIVLESFFNTPTLFPYNGNLLIDDASALVPMDCRKEPGEAPVVPEPAEDPFVLDPVTPRPPVSTPPRTPPTPAEKTVKIGNTRGRIAEGEVFQVENITFSANKSEITPESREALEEIYNFLRANPEVVVEIGGHASSLASDVFANELSTERAKAVVSYLTKRGISYTRLAHQGYGKSRRIASGTSPEANRKNQRVEVKIIKLQ